MLHCQEARTKARRVISARVIIDPRVTANALARLTNPASPGDGRFVAAQRPQRDLRSGRGAGAQKLENPPKTELLLNVEKRAPEATAKGPRVKCAGCGTGLLR